MLPDLRVLIVADDPLARRGLALLLDNVPGCTVVAASSSHDPPAASADVMVWDLGWDPPDGLSLEGAVPGGGVPLVVLLPEGLEPTAVHAPGVTGYLRRELDAERLAAALAAAAQGLVVLDPAYAPELLPESAAHVELSETLTPRESEVLQLLAEGLSNRAIAHRLGISEHTVKFHVNAILGKLGAQSRTEAVVQATRLGLILL